MPFRAVLFGRVSDLLDKTDTTLGAGETYTGDAVKVENFVQLIGSVRADVDGTLKVQQSQNGDNWDTESSFSYTGGNKDGFSVEVVAPYARLVFENGAAAQGSFRLAMRGRSH